MEPESAPKQGEVVAGRYNLRKRLVQIRPSVSDRVSRVSDRVSRVSDRFRSITEARLSAKKSSATPRRRSKATSPASHKNTYSKVDELPKGTPFPRWKFPGSKIRYPFNVEGCSDSTWPISNKEQRAIMENAILPYVPLALKLCKDNIKFVRMMDICTIDFYGTAFNLKFEAEDNESTKVYFAQLHFSEDTAEKCHISRCCLYDPTMLDIPYIHADCLTCFPKPSDGYKLNRKAGKCATAVFKRVIRVRQKHPDDVLFDGCYFLTDQEEDELVDYHSVGVAKLALEHFKSRTKDFDLKFVKVLAYRFFGKQMFNVKFKVKRESSADYSELFVAQVHMTSELHDLGVEGHVSVCHAYDSINPGFPPHCAVCKPRLSKGKLKYRHL